MLHVVEKVHEVIDFGCEWVWVIAPETLESRVYTQEGDFSLPHSVFRIPGTEIEVPLRSLEEA